MQDQTEILIHLHARKTQLKKKNYLFLKIYKLDAPKLILIMEYLTVQFAIINVKPARIRVQTV